MAKRKISLIRVARIYNEAIQAGMRAPVRAVAEIMEIPYDTATKKVAEARRLKVLAPVAGMGTHRSVTAEIHRGTPRQKRFEVCEVCLEAYPCATVRECESEPGRLNNGSDPRTGGLGSLPPLEVLALS